MTATYTWDVLSTLDGYGSFAEGAGRGGYGGQQVPELHEHRPALLAPEQRRAVRPPPPRTPAQALPPAAAANPSPLLVFWPNPFRPTWPPQAGFSPPHRPPPAAPGDVRPLAGFSHLLPGTPPLRRLRGGSR